MVNTLVHPTIKRYEEVFEIYTDLKSRESLGGVEEFIFAQKYDIAEKLLKNFKTEAELLQVLEDKLNGKPIHKTLKKIRKGTVESKSELLKGLFSLGTHAAIEVQSGHVEYVYIMKRIHEKIGELL